ncbi:hypothetical protein BU26DRAFT_569977 [Trematosphaeria pertusa]|uniref:Uncharacterized protein n=1 Tax=Trematosphaeria pertusa TaxID=390896 RepID=A0A6A6HZ25_9PLEO|nr:uncharacterized protein BU26DRAFT_569977 [Trematosphaeria pertusa]KAF2243276.1 hypothetical protein BU26DRAFT_569977 [Trematosphaeria pertusa]
MSLSAALRRAISHLLYCATAYLLILIATLCRAISHLLYYATAYLLVQIVVGFCVFAIPGILLCFWGVHIIYKMKGKALFGFSG